MSGNSVFGGCLGALRRAGVTVAAVATVLGVGLGGVLTATPAGAVTATNTWTGQDANSPWSLADNWSPGVPTNGADLSFPVLGGDCTSSTPSGTCYVTHNDLTGLSLDSISVDGAASYTISGNSVSLGAGGLTVIGPNAYTYANELLGLPITLSADQTWTVGGNNGLTVAVNGAVSGAQNLGISLAQGVTVNLNGDVEVGTATITGANGADTGTQAIQNGTVNLGTHGLLNATSGSQVNLVNARLSGAGTTGPLQVTGGLLSVGAFNPSPGVLNVAGAASFDSASAVNFKVPGPGSVVGTNYSQLAPTGNVTLGNARLAVNFGSSSSCFIPTLGQQYTLVSAGGTVSGIFDDGSGNPVTDGSLVPLTLPGICGSTAELLKINYTASAVTATVVAPTSTVAAVSPSTVTVGDSVTYSATVTSPIGTVGSGSVAFVVNGNQMCAATVVAGAASCSSTAAPVNQYGWTVTANYGGTSSYLGSTGTTTLTVNPPAGALPTQTAIQVSPSTVTQGDTVTYSATVTAGTGTPTGTVDFKIGTTDLCTATLSGGSGSCTSTGAPVAAGGETVTGYYSGDVGFLGSNGTTTLTVNPSVTALPTTTVISVIPTTVTVGQNVAYFATVSASSGTPTGTVAFSIGATQLCTAVLSGGTGNCTSSGAPQGTNQTVTGTFSPNTANYLTSSGTTPLNVNAVSLLATTTAITALPSPVTTGTNVTYQATVSSTSGTPTGTVDFKIGTTDLCTATLISGVGSCIVNTAPQGTNQTVTGYYSGDSNYATSQGTTTLTVNPPVTAHPTTTTIGVNPASVLAGHTVQYSAQVTSASPGTPTGSVAFFIGATQLCTAVLSSATGSCTSTGAPVGSDQVVGVYSGDANFLQSQGHTPLAVGVVDQGYWLVAADGGIFAFGDAGFYGSMGGQPLNEPIVTMAGTPDGKGYWLAATDGGMFSFGDAQFYGSTGNITLNQPIVGMAPTADGRGYWLVASDGGLFAFGDAGFYGSMGGLPLNEPVVGMAATPDGKGYWLVASDGGLFAFGDAAFYGSTGALTLNKPVVGMAATPDGKGYWLVASDGGLFAFGDAGFFGSTGALTLNSPVVGMQSTSNAGGYWLVATDGGIFAFGNAAFFGSTGSMTLNSPVVGIASS